MNPNQNRSNERNSNNNVTGWVAGAGAVAAGAAIVGSLLYWFTKTNASTSRGSLEPAAQVNEREQPHSTVTLSGNAGDKPESGHSSYLGDLIKRMDTPDTTHRTGSSKGDVNNLNSLLATIYNEYIALKRSDFDLHYDVFKNVFYKLHETMKDVDPYYKRYSSKVDFTGSHADGLRINKPDEFDMDVVIRLPLNMERSSNAIESDVVIIAKSPGFVELKMGQQYGKLPERDVSDWSINKTAYLWRDNSNFLLRSKFSNWFKGLVNRALNKFNINGKLIYVKGVPYTIRTSESGPAITLIIENASKKFRLDFDVVPALRFPKSRWPVSRTYRNIPSSCIKEYWTVVPKPNKGAVSERDQDRSWRISLHEQEKEILHGCHNLKQGIKFLKKLRDAQGMKKIASYYIKTLFLFETCERADRSFWSKSNPATIFKIMLKKFHDALMKGEIPYFWNRNNNLLAQIDKGLLKVYASKLTKLMQILEEPGNHKQVAKYLLTDVELQEFNMNHLLI